MVKKQLLFSVTANDCRFVTKRGSGNGGQKKQKTSSGIQCFHDPSGAMGECTDSRDQPVNRKRAFKRMTETKEFQSWLMLKIEASKGTIEITEATDQGNKVTRKLRMDEV